MPNVDISGWSKRNIWRLPSGELAVRPGMRRVYNTLADAVLINGCFTVRNEASGNEVWHYYVGTLDFSQTRREPTLVILDENMVKLFELTLATNVVPRVVTYAVVQDRIVIASPDFPTLEGGVGLGVTLASSQPSLDTTTTALANIPQGVCTAWIGSRVVIASGRSIYVSDPITIDSETATRSYVGENAMNLPGVIFGLHEAGNGMLLACTDQGVYGLDASAGSVAQLGTGADWRLVNHHRISNYGQSCVVNGRVWALSKRGMMLVDTENDTEVVLNEPMMSIAIGAGRYALEDFRQARILAGENGPIVASDDLGAVVMTDFTVTPPVVSWWKHTDFAASGTTYPTSSIVGTVRDFDDTEMLVGAHGIYRVAGDFDGTQLLSSFSTHHTGSFRGQVPADVTMNARVRFVWTAAAIGGGAPTVRAAFDGVAPIGVVPTLVDSTGITIGTDSWGTKMYQTTPLSQVRFQFGTASPPTNELAFEVGADSGMARIHPIAGFDYSESAPDRPKNTG